MQNFGFSWHQEIFLKVFEFIQQVYRKVTLLEGSNIQKQYPVKGRPWYSNKTENKATIQNFAIPRNCNFNEMWIFHNMIFSQVRDVNFSQVRDVTFSLLRNVIFSMRSVQWDFSRSVTTKILLILGPRGFAYSRSKSLILVSVETSAQTSVPNLLRHPVDRIWLSNARILVSSGLSADYFWNWALR